MNRIHPTAIIGPEVELGDGNQIGPYTVILGTCSIGDDNWIGPHVAIGTPGEMRGVPHAAAWDGEPSAGATIIGSRNVLREFLTIQGGHDRDTRVGDDGYFMTKAHIPHDALIGNSVTLSCGVLVGGHSIVGDNANIGLNAVVHQQLVVGRGAMIGMSSVVTKHIPPFAKAFGSPARVRGANTVGLSRAGVEVDPAALDEALLAGDSGQLATLLPADMVVFARDVDELAH